MNTTAQSNTRQTPEKSFAERVADAQAEVPAVSAGEAHQRRDDQPGTLILDPRPADAIASTTGLIEGAVNIPLAVLDGDGELPSELASTARPVITACQAGPMGALAAQALKHRGFTRVAYIDGGTQAWLDAGFRTRR